MDHLWFWHIDSHLKLGFANLLQIFLSFTAAPSEIFNLPKLWWIILALLEKYSTWEFHRNTYIIRVFDDALVLRVIWTEELNLCFVVFHTLRFPVQLTVKTREKYVTPGGITKKTHQALTQNQLFSDLTHVMLHSIFFYELKHLFCLH